MSIHAFTRLAAALLASFFLWAGGTALASAQSNNASNYMPARPVYLDVHPVGGAEKVLSADLVAAMVQQSLTARGESVIRTSGDSLPNHVRVLRIIYVVQRQPTGTGFVMAASADIDLLRTANDRHDIVLATSIYSGVQQSLIQGTNASGVKTRLRAAFKVILDKRIKQAFTNTAAQ